VMYPYQPQPSPPLSKGGEGTGVGGFCLQKAASVRRTRVADVYPYQKPRRRSHFSNTLCQPLRVFEKCGFCPPPAGSPHCVRGTQSVRFPLPAGGTQLTPHPNHPIRHTPTAHITPIRTLHTPKHLLDPTSGLREGSGGDRARFPRRAGRGAARVGEPVQTAIG
jgi:hypothetical protein